jgi:hypothetical protein
VCSEVRSLTVLDHHETTTEELTGLDFVTLDTEKSGAVLAWEFLAPARRAAQACPAHRRS